MTGKPAVRQGDETLSGGPIVQGSLTVPERSLSSLEI
jgi:uncharacterized Zn-binding protein involved in type VI secretion